MLEKLAHHRIVSYHGCVEEDGYRYLFMDYMAWVRT